MPSVKWSARTVQGGDIEPLLTRAYPEVRFINKGIIVQDLLFFHFIVELLSILVNLSSFVS